jgi:hypothetical protein
MQLLKIETTVHGYVGMAHTFKIQKLSCKVNCKTPIFLIV